MVQIIWIIEADPRRLAEFEDAYGANGQWVELFRKADGYLKTDLLSDVELSTRFIVIDRWVELENYESFKNRYRNAYERLDRQCESLTLNETRIGTFKC